MSRPPHVSGRLGAILELGIKLRESGDLEERLVTLEKMLTMGSPGVPPPTSPPPLPSPPSSPPPGPQESPVAGRSVTGGRRQAAYRRCWTES